MTGAEGRARTIDVDGTFAGEGEDMIAALIAASANPATRGGAGRGEGTTRGFEKDGDVVKAKRSFERELVPFDFEDGTSAVDAVVRESERRGRGEAEGEEDDGGADAEGSRERGADEGEDEGTETETESGAGAENGGFNRSESASESSV